VTTTNKDFRVKNGLIVEGNSATVNGNQVITSADAANYALKNAANTFTTSPQQINAASSAIGLIVKANATTPGNLQQWQDSAGNVLASVNSEGFISIGTPISIFGQPPVPFSNTLISAQTSTGSQVGIAVRGVLFQTGDLQQWQNVIGTTLLRINNAGQIQAPQPASVGVVVKAAPDLTATVTNASGNGINITYTATNTFKQGQVVTITGVNPAAYNLSSVTITDANATNFTVSNAATGTYVSGGYAVVLQSGNLQEWQGESGSVLANVSSSGGFTVPSLTVSGDFTVNGTTTNINSTNLVIEDKNIVLGDTTTPTDITADGGGITLKGTTDKTFNWVDSTDSWTSSEHINLASGKSLYLNNTLLKDATETLTNKTLTSPTIDTPLLTLSTTSSTTDGRIAWDSTNDKILVGGTLNSVSQAVEFASSTLTISTPTFTTNAYTVVLADKDKWLELSNGATAGTLNIPTDATANFAIGTQLNILQTGAGQITIAAVTPGTTTVNGSPGLKLRGQWSVATIVKRAANTWVAVGDLSA
jgi:hypothetical protein